jgi:hypothetical protein
VVQAAVQNGEMVILCYYWPFIYNIFALRVYLTIIVVYIYQSIRIWFYWVALNNLIDLEILAKCLWGQKAFNIKETMLISIHGWLCPFYYIGWVQNLETKA